MPLFNELYPQAKVGDVFNELLEKTDRLFSCDICKKTTGWRDLGLEAPVPICSTECAEKLYKRAQS